MLVRVISLRLVIEIIKKEEKKKKKRKREKKNSKGIVK